jgi:hypothetical protein
MCPTKIIGRPGLARVVMRSCLARASLWALAVTVWLVLGAVVPGSARDEVRAHAGDANIALRALPERGPKVYVRCKDQQFGGIDVEIGESGLRCRPFLIVQCMSVACTA